jgi:1-deoxy-D-xylulose-5-phosphate synthase
MLHLLESIHTPADVKNLPQGKLHLLADEIRQTILETVSRNGGHLASNLGSVELSIALLRVFCPPHDQIVWDVGHQTYTWKLLTGRFYRFQTLRKFGGLSGFPKPNESPCDPVIAGHAGVALSTALGLAVGRDRLELNNHVIAVIGDGAMTNGITLEALNSLGDTGTKVIIVLNDNEMSISQNVGALSRRLGRMLADLRYNRIKTAAEAAGHRLHMTFLRGIYHHLESVIKSIWLQNSFFEQFGLRYVGPIDGHDLNALENAFRSASEYKSSVVIHVATQKGRGFKPAEREPQNWHGVGKFDPDSNEQPSGKKHGWSQAFGDALCAFAQENPKVIAITAAMRDGTGLTDFAERFPDRFFDVGICEEHAVAFAAGLATAGFKPVFAVYSTFLQRAIDCVMHDVCLSRLPVLFCVDRAGVVGNDGPTHNGVFDIPMLRCLPGITIMQPRDRQELAGMIRCAFRHNAPCVIRYPKDPLPDEGTPSQEIPPVLYGRAEVIEPAQTDIGAPMPIWIWALGDKVPAAVAIAKLLRESGKNVGVVNARFIKPLDLDLLLAQARRARCIVTIENGTLSGGFGSAIREALSGNPCLVKSFGWPDAFIPQGTVEELLSFYRLTPQDIAAALLAE